MSKHGFLILITQRKIHHNRGILLHCHPKATQASPLEKQGGKNFCQNGSNVWKGVNFESGVILSPESCNRHKRCEGTLRCQGQSGYSCQSFTAREAGKTLSSE